MQEKFEPIPGYYEYLRSLNHKEVLGSFIGRKEWKSKFFVDFQQRSCLVIALKLLKNVGSYRLETTFEPSQNQQNP